jgi:hypothetical protein
MSKDSKGEAQTFFVDTHFQRMARRPGGLPRELAIERAQAQIDELKPEGTDWLDRELKELDVRVRQAGGNFSDESELDRAIQSCCQLRDVGASVGFELFTFIANNLCEILEAIKSGAAYEKNMILCHIDALFLASKNPYRSLRPEQLPEMTSGLRRVVELASISQARSIK